MGVCLDRSVDAIVAILGVWKAGGTYLPIDPSHPPAHIAYVFGDARPFALVADRLLAGTASMPTLAPRAGDEGEGVRDCDADLPRAVGLDNLAYVIYTSGSPQGARRV